MDEYTLKKMIEKLLYSQYEKKALIILTGGNSYSEEIFKILSKYNNVKYDYVISENSLKVDGIEKWESIGQKIEGIEPIYEALKDAEYIVIPFLTRNTLAKVATGIADNEVTTSIQLALMMGKTVISVDTSWNPESELAKLMKLNNNKAYNKMLFDYKAKAMELGMSSVPVYNLENEINRCLHKDVSKNEIYEKNTNDEKNSNEYVAGDSADKNGTNFITQEEIMGKDTLYLPQNGKLTHLAQEYVRENKVKVINV